MRTSDWSSDVCSSALAELHQLHAAALRDQHPGLVDHRLRRRRRRRPGAVLRDQLQLLRGGQRPGAAGRRRGDLHRPALGPHPPPVHRQGADGMTATVAARSEEHTSELQSLMRISYAVFCLKKKTKKKKI